MRFRSYIISTEKNILRKLEGNKNNFVLCLDANSESVKVFADNHQNSHEQDKSIPWNFPLFSLNL